MSQSSNNVNEYIVLCALSDLPDPGSKGFSLTFSGEPLELFVVRKLDQVVAYRNSCPHTGGPLDWVPDQFLDAAASEIQCASHDARFRIDDGHCLSGPCVGQALQALTVQVINGDVVLTGQPGAEPIDKL